MPKQPKKRRTVMEQLLKEVREIEEQNEEIIKEMEQELDLLRDLFNM